MKQIFILLLIAMFLVITVFPVHADDCVEPEGGWDGPPPCRPTNPGSVSSKHVKVTPTPIPVVVPYPMPAMSTPDPYPAPKVEPEFGSIEFKVWFRSLLR